MKLNENQNKLLSILEKHNSSENRHIYKPGPYWDYKTKKILFWLKKNGLDNFRGFNSGVGTSYCDNVVIDIRNELGQKGRIASLFFSLPIIKKIFDLQLEITKDHASNIIKLNNKIYNLSDRVKFLINKFKINNSISFGCVNNVSIDNLKYSTTYLEMINRIDYLTKIYDFKKINSFIEIGGGFGSNIHLLIQNFPNIKKIVYADIFPNIFVGTEYLRSFYKDNVRDYTSLSNLKEINFQNNKDLEIICIPTWCLEKINTKIDKFHNAASFQEMTINQIINYKEILYKILNKKQISLIIYKGWEKNNTLSPDQINAVFDNELKKTEHTQLGTPNNFVCLTN